MKFTNPGLYPESRATQNKTRARLCKLIKQVDLSTQKFNSILLFYLFLFFCVLDKKQRFIYLN